jgi:predicted RNase H-like nuclease (RuvC/YqgF family)
MPSSGIGISANVVAGSPILATLMMEAIRSSEITVLTRARRRYIPEDRVLPLVSVLELLEMLVLGFQLPHKRYHDTLYSCLLKEHLDLQREYQFLQSRLKRELAQPNRIRLRLEHELAATRTQVRKLKKKLADQEGTVDC